MPAVRQDGFAHASTFAHRQRHRTARLTVALRESPRAEALRAGRRTAACAAPSAGCPRLRRRSR